MTNTTTTQLQIVPVTLLQNGDWYYPVRQDTQEVIKDEGMSLVVGWPSIDRRSGTIQVPVSDGRMKPYPRAYQAGAVVARGIRR